MTQVGISTFYEQWHDSAGANRENEIRDRDVIVLRELSPMASVFELGCGSGTILSLLPQTQRRAGVDISAKAIDLAKRRTGLPDENLRVCNVDEGELPFGSGQFEACLASEVLEHLFDPIHALAELNRLLAPGGRLVVTVPNIGYYLFRLYHLLHGEVSDFHGNGVVLSEHIRFYSSRSLTKLLELTGFSNIRILGVMKEKVGTAASISGSRRTRSLAGLARALAPTPMNIVSKTNRLFSLWQRRPGLFAVGLLAIAEKAKESEFRSNYAVDHQRRDGREEQLLLDRNPWQ